MPHGRHSIISLGVNVLPIEPELVAERIFHDSKQRLLGAEQRSTLPVTLSLGVALFPSRDVRTKDALLRGADAALHAAKRDGGNRICVYQQQGHMYTPVSGSVCARRSASVSMVFPLKARLTEPYCSARSSMADRSSASPRYRPCVILL